ncbi:MAG: aminoglycoside phosphotransferase family protein [Gammaproteobacteria bacterium]|nr:aminoglycoside phosphotransferase family protein [Gammaproteobacteria bacterium]
MNLDLTLVKAKWIVQESTDLEVVKASLLGEGNDFVSYLINDEWVFRFPKSWANADKLLHEREFLKALTIPVRTPRFKYWETNPSGYPVPVAGYRIIRGDILESLQPESCDAASLAIEIADVLGVLHGHRTKSVPNQSERTDYWLQQSNDDLWIGLDEFSREEIEEAQAFLNQYRNDSNQASKDVVVIHGDLGVEHIITDGARHLRGIIDWSNSCLGNRFFDFIGLWGWGGDEFVVESLCHYGAMPDSSEWALIRSWGLIYCIGRYKLAHARNRTTNIATRTRLRKRIEEVAGTRLYAEP